MILPDRTPPASLVDSLLLKMSAHHATRALRDAGYDGQLKRMELRLSQLISQGKRQPLPRPSGGAVDIAPEPREVSASAEAGCRKLHDATMTLFKRIAAANREEVRTVAVWLQGTLDARSVVA